MDDLTAFVTARLDEDQAAAKKYADSARRIGYTTDDEIDGWNLGMHPMRDLRDIAAKRRMLSDTWGGPDHEDMWQHHVRLLAAVYSDHPDYRPEWAPEGAPDGT